MLALRKNNKEKSRYIANILPCQINYNGPVSASKRYWDPVDHPDGLSVAYFRGKKLHGKRLRLPNGYRKVVVSKTDKTIPKKTQDFAENTCETENKEILQDEEDEVDVKILEEQSELDDILIWGHESLPEETADPFLKGVQEWIDFSHLIHSYDDDVNDTEQTSSVKS